MIRWAVTGGATLLLLPALALAAVGGGINLTTPSQTAVADIPADYLLLYQEAGLGFDMPWEVLAGIGKVECDHGRNPDPACWKQGAENAAGAGGPMQFLASTWQQYGVAASGSGTPDRWNPADAIVSAANFLKQNGAPDKIAQAVPAGLDGRLAELAPQRARAAAVDRGRIRAGIQPCAHPAGSCSSFAAVSISSSRV